MFWRRLQDILKGKKLLSWRRLQDVFTKMCVCWVQGRTKLLWKGTWKLHYIEERLPSEFYTWNIENVPKRSIKTSTIFCLTKTDQKKLVQVASIFHPSKLNKKVHRNGVEYFPIEITSKKHFEMTYKFVDMDVLM